MNRLRTASTSSFIGLSELSLTEARLEQFRQPLERGSPLPWAAILE